MDTDIPVCANTKYGYLNSDRYLQWRMINSSIHYKKRHIRDILGRTNFFCHTYDTSMTIIVTKPGIIIDVVGSYFYDKKS